MSARKVGSIWGLMIIGVDECNFSPEEIQFNIDGATLFNMLDGMSYEQAVKEARDEFKEMQKEE